MTTVRGYMRISTRKKEQKFDRQESTLEDKVDVIYKDRLSGKNKKRPQLQQMLEDLNEGDTVLIHSIDRMSRSTKDLLQIVDDIKDKGASLKSIQETWLDTSGDNPMSRFLMVVMGALAEWERKNTVKRVNEGLAVAKSKGKKLGRPELPDSKTELALKLYDEDEHTVKEIAEITGMSRKSVYNKLNEREERQEREAVMNG